MIVDAKRKYRKAKEKQQVADRGGLDFSGVSPFVQQMRVRAALLERSDKIILLILLILSKKLRRRRLSSNPDGQDCGRALVNLYISTII